MTSFGWTEWLSMMGSFAIVLALLIATLIAIKKMAPKMGISGTKRLQLIEVQNLGGRQKLMLVKVNNEQVLIGLSGQNMTKLGTFPFEDEKHLEVCEASTGAKIETLETSVQGTFKNILARSLKK